MSSSNSTFPTQKYSCVHCQQRKVKCDKILPSCNVCALRGLDCHYRVPPPPRRGKRKIPPEDLPARLRRYEELLRKHGVDFEEQEVEQSSCSRRGDSRENEHQVSKAYNTETEMSYELNEGHDSSVENEANTPGNAARSDNDYPFVLGWGSKARASLAAFHPPPALIFALWEVFLRNVDPVVKVLHVPTVQSLILEASRDLKNIPPNFECLMFAIYSAAVNSMDDAACFAIMNESKAALFAKFQTQCEQALRNADFLSSFDLTTLQGYFLFLVSVRSEWDPNRVWIIVGIAIRLAQRIGLHRDGENLKLSVFEVEMRRRLWFQIVWLEIKAAELCGMRATGDPYAWDAESPLNVNDADLSPNMLHPPANRQEPTEMVFGLVRCDLLQYIKRWGLNTTPGEAARFPLSDKDRAVDGLEMLLGDRVKFCDMSVPIQYGAYLLAHTCFMKARLIGHNPRQYADNRALLPLPEQETIFHLALKITTFHNLAETIPQFKWHSKLHFQWEVFVQLLEELLRRGTGFLTSLTNEAWEEVRKAYENHPEIIQNTSKRLYVEIGNLTLKAWDAHNPNMGQHQDTPTFISALRIRNAALGESQTSNFMATLLGDQSSNQSAGHCGVPSTQAVPLHSNEWVNSLDWQYWHRIFQSGYQYENVSQGTFEDLYRF